MTEDKKKISLVGLATLITALTAIPGMILNTYLDYKERSNSELVQQSSYTNTATAIEDLSGDIDKCMTEVNDLKKDIYELKGYVRGRMHRASRPQTESVDEAEAADTTKMKRKPMVDFDDIVQHVEKTGKAYIQQEPVDIAASPQP